MGGSKVFPTVAYKIDGKKQEIESALLDTYNTLNIFGKGEGIPQLNKQSFTQGCFILAIDLSRDSDCFAAYNNSAFTSQLTLEGTFKEALPENYTLMIIGVFNGNSLSLYYKYGKTK